MTFVVIGWQSSSKLSQRYRVDLEVTSLEALGTAEIVWANFIIYIEAWDKDDHRFGCGFVDDYYKVVVVIGARSWWFFSVTRARVGQGHSWIRPQASTALPKGSEHPRSFCLYSAHP